MIRLVIENETIFKFKYRRLFKKIIKELSHHQKLTGDIEVSLIINDNEAMREISSKYRNKDITTDILSFPADYKELKDTIGYNMLGDIFMNNQKLEKQALEFNHSSKREWAYLFTHGLLHLLGYDHKTIKEESAMNKIAYIIMKRIGVDRDA
ncbi:MAG: rRNA maturation RNase YbeY [Mycoplasmataceae bacterium]|nr:rRNA maturation RNase YbeY [Mycoplasmataceae bacterium]